MTFSILKINHCSGAVILLASQWNGISQSGMLHKDTTRVPFVSFWVNGDVIKF
jgi:hypothetical protein